MESRRSKTMSIQFAVIMSLFAMAMSFTGSAQGNQYNNRVYDREPFISIYEDCNFSGQRRDVAVGEFRSMRELDFGNDKMSSIKVPRELEAVIFEHDKFKGDYARVDRDIRCFDSYWNDGVSSLKVQYRDRRNNPTYGRDGGQGEVYGGRGNRPRGGYNDGVTGNNVTRVVFGNRVLENVGQGRWQMQSRIRGGAQYQEISRDSNTVILQNDYLAERIEIDLFTNDVIMIGPRGKQKKYRISSRNANVVRAQPNSGLSPDTRITSRCFDYYVYTNGSAGGIRFSNGKDFFRFQERGHKGRICHRGELTVEITKRDFDADVTFEVAGRTFKFAAGEKETQFRANWYRKVIKLQVGQ